jgi:hypothetical protein
MKEKRQIEGIGCLVAVSCIVGVVFWIVLLMISAVLLPESRVILILIAFILMPVTALGYALVGRLLASPFCLFVEWATGESFSFHDGGVFVAAFWPLLPLAAIPLLIYGCVRRLF